VLKLFGAGAPSRIGHAVVLDFQRARQAHSRAAMRHVRVFDPDATSSLFCTGGTTGAPKIAMRSHRNEISDTYQVAAMNPESAAPDKVVFCGLPLFHVNAGLVTGLVPFSAGGHVVLGTPMGYRGNDVIRNFWKIVEHYRINFFSGVPTVYGALLNVPVNGAEIGCLEYDLCGAAPMPVELFHRFERMTGVKILEGYGLTEGTCVSAVNPPAGERKIGSIGLRLPHQEMIAVQLGDDGAYLRDCVVDEVGVIAIRGPNVFKGYVDPEHERGLWIRRDAGPRWLNTGDLGRQDADGYFWLTGRKKELIIRGGHNIDPATIEAPMQTHEAIELCAAIGRPDAHAGEVPVLYVQLRDGEQASVEALLQYAREVIAERAALPKAVHIVEALPLTAVGKIFKPALRAREIESVVRATISEFTDVAVERLEVRHDQRRGLLAHARLRGSEADLSRVAAALGVYAFAFDILPAVGASAEISVDRSSLRT
jgi:fatty-acyl-CoA synthase